MGLMNQEPRAAATTTAAIDEILHLPIAYTDSERSRLVALRDEVSELSTHLTPGGSTPLGHATMLGSAAAAIREASDILAAARLRPNTAAQR